MLDRIREKLTELNPTNLKYYHSGTLYRFCRARKFDVNETFKMLQEDVKWRKDNDVDSIIDTFPKHEKYQDLVGYWPGRLHGIDKEEYNVYYEKLGN